MDMQIACQFYNLLIIRALLSEVMLLNHCLVPLSKLPFPIPEEVQPLGVNSPISGPPHLKTGQHHRTPTGPVR